MAIHDVFGAKYKNISEKAAETRLKKMQKGEYLVRPDKKNAGGFIVSVKMLDEKINHYPIIARMESANQFSFFLRENRQPIPPISVFVNERIEDMRVAQQNKAAAKQQELAELRRKTPVEVNKSATKTMQQQATAALYKHSANVNEAAAKNMREQAKTAVNKLSAKVDEAATKNMREQAKAAVNKFTARVDDTATEDMRAKTKTVLENLYRSYANNSTAKILTATGANGKNAMPAQQVASRVTKEAKATPTKKPTPLKPQVYERNYTNDEIAAGLILTVAPKPKKLTSGQAEKLTELSQTGNWQLDAHGNARSNVLLPENEANNYVNKLKANLPPNSPLNFVTIERHYSANSQPEYSIVINNALLKSSLPMVQQAKSKIDTQPQKSPQQTAPAQAEKEEMKEPKTPRPGRY